MLDHFLSRWGGAHRESSLDREALVRVLENAARLGEQAWPAVVVDRAVFAAYLGERIAGESDPAPAIEGLVVTDLYLACALALGVHAAIVAFEAELMPEVLHAIRRVRASEAQADDLAQELRERLLVGDTARGPRILAYAGRGSLRRWLRATAVRTQLNHIRDHRREVLVDDTPLLDAVAGSPEVHVEPNHARYADALARAFAAAMTALPDREKALLRMAYVDRVGLEGLGRAFGVSRATAHRWLCKAREQLAADTEARMMADLSVPRDAIASIRRLVQSQVLVSVARLLAS